MALLKKQNHIWSSSRNIRLKKGLNLGHTLKKTNLDYRVRASTLMETLVATVLIVIVFMVSSMIMNNLLQRKVKQNTELAEERLHALEYQYKNKGIQLPYYEDFESWEISVFKEKSGNASLITLEAEHNLTNKIVTNYISSED